MWEKHWRRLRENAFKLKIDIGEFSEQTVKTALSELIVRNGFETGRARITFFDEAGGGLWKRDPKTSASCLITTANRRENKAEMRLTAAPFPVNSRSPLANVKSCNYLENLLVFEDARRRGFDEAVRLNEKGALVSAAMANIFWAKNGKIYTPALETGCLAGTTREFLTENFSVCEVTAGFDELIEADEIFLTSSGLGVCPGIFEKTAAKSRRVSSKMAKLLDLQGVKS